MFVTAVVVLGAAVALAFPVLIPHDPNQISSDILQPPFANYSLGTDELGRSVALQLAYGLRVSLLIGLLTAVSATLVGIAVGSIAGYFGGWFDTLLMRVSEVFQVMPTFILAVLIVALVGGGVFTVIAVIAILAWPESARLMRGEVLRVKHLDFVDAARALGIDERRVMFGEVIPNALGPVIVIGTLIIGRAILVEAALSFLGLSSPDVVSWGRMLNSGQQFLFRAWWLSVFPGLAVFVTVVTFNLLGDAIGGALNPKHAHS
jgi:peptide/nickel transport system permease protein